MKKRFWIIIYSLLICNKILFSQEVVLSKKLTAEILEHTKISQKNIKGGINIIITAKNPHLVNKVKRIVLESINSPEVFSKQPDEIIELLRVKHISKSITWLNNGIRIILTTKKSEWIYHIKKLRNYLKRYKKTS